MLLCFSLLLGLAATAASVQTITGADGKPRVLMTTKTLRLQINPTRGGRVDDVQYAAWGNTAIIQDKVQGLFCDHFWQEYWPGQFWEAPYDYKILTAGPDEIAVRVSCLSKDKGVPQVAGILVEKTFTLREGDDRVRVSVRLTNTTAEGKYVGYWMQHVCWLGGGKEGDRYFRPSKRGVSTASSDDANPPDAGFIREPQAGWTAAVDAKTQQGLVFLMDYNDLWFLYNCCPANTIEWQYDAVAIPAGKSWETAVTMLPTTGMQEISYASEDLLAGVRYFEKKDSLFVATAFQSTAGTLPPLEVSAGLTALVSNASAGPVKAAPLSSVRRDTQSVLIGVPYDGAKREPAVVRLALHGTNAAGKPLDAKPEFWYPGNWVSNTNPTDGSPYYAIPSAAKVKSVIKPDVIVRRKTPAPSVLYLKGFQSTAYRIEPALTAVKPPVTVKTAYAYTGVFGPQLDDFPYDYNVLMQYDLVILGDLSTGYLGTVALEMLKDYVAHGGHLLVLGGPFAYGAGGYASSVLAEVLPVTCRNGRDLEPAKGTVTAVSGAPIPGLQTLRFTYLHAITPKPGAQTLLTCGKAPLLVTGTYGQGSVACFTGTPLGKDNPCAAAPWGEVLARLLPALGMAR
jgi:hypothetical protein